MGELSFPRQIADKKSMGTPTLTLLVSLFALFTMAPSAEADWQPSACRIAQSKQNQINAAKQTELNHVNSDPSYDTTPDEAQIKLLIGQKALDDTNCSQQTSEVAEEKNKCDTATTRDGPGMWKMDSGKCVSAVSAVGSNPNSGDCSNASLFNGGLKGQNCQSAATTIKDVTSQQEAVTAATTAATTLATQAYSQQATGAQGNAQTSQANIYKAMAVAKLATGGMSLANAMRLHSAASDAEDASSAISSKQKDLSTHCDQVVKSTASADEPMTMDQCFARDAAAFGVDTSDVSKANFDRMKTGATEAQAQADKASSAAKTAMIQGLADAAVAAQAYQASQAATANANAAVTAGTVYQTPSYAFNSSTGGSMGGVGTTAAAANPNTGLGAAEGGTQLGVTPQAMQGSMMPGKSFGVASTPYGQGAPSGVSTGGSLGGGGGGGSGGGPSSGKSAKGKSNNNTIGGEYAMTGSLQKSAPTSGGGKDASNPFADALAKLFPPDKATGAPTAPVDTRELASDGNTMDGVVTGADDGKAADLSIFEQITSKYRQMASNGQI